ncbi:MAG: MarR family winged helix-turn-helix transcriptional regulator [Bacillota bacterium]
MRQTELRDELMDILASLYELEAFAALAEFLQGELRILHYLLRYRHQETNPSLLSEKLHVSRSRITAALAALRKKGFVRMEVSEADRRRMLVLLTARGESFIQSKKQVVEQYFDRLVAGLGEQRVIQLRHLIQCSIEIMTETEPAR